MSEFQKNIDSEQDRINKSIKEDTTVIDEPGEKLKASETYLKKVDAFQATLNASVQDPVMKDALNGKVLNFLKKAISPEIIESLQGELESALKNYEKAIKAYEKWRENKYEVKNGDDLSKIVEEKLGVSWKIDPKTHFAIVDELQMQRMEGSFPEIDENGNFLPQKIDKGAEFLDIGEYLNLEDARSKAIPSIEAIRKYAGGYKQLLKIADELSAKEELGKTSDVSAQEIKDEEIVAETIRPSFIMEVKTSGDDYSQKAGESAELSFEEDFEENFQVDPKIHGYIPAFEKAILATQDVNNPFGDSDENEHRALEDIRICCQSNLSAFSQKLDGANDKEKQNNDYKTAESKYVESAKRFVELCASVDEKYESTDARRVNSAIETANQLMPRMSLEESITWSTEMLAKIDSNDFQSSAISTDYQKLFEVLKDNLKQKLENEKNGGDYASYSKSCITLAKTFSGRSGAIDSALCDSKWAGELALEASNTSKIYIEILNKKVNVLPGMEKFQDAYEERKGETLTYLKRQNPVIESAIQVLEGPVNSQEDLMRQWSVIVPVKFLIDGKEMPSQEVLEGYIQNKVAPVMIEAHGAFIDHIKQGEGTDPAILSKELGVNLDPYQIEGINLLNDIEGNGWFDLSDQSWDYAEAGAKICASIAVGVAAAVLTAPCSLIVGAAAAGLAMTASNAVINQTGFEDGAQGFVDAYGADMIINTATMGSARYLAAGRAVLQMKSAGAIQGGYGKVFLSPQGREIMKLASQRGGMRVISSLDEGMGLGNRLVGASLEGAADVTIGATLDTVFTGGTFEENLQNNAMFFGVGFGMEFGGPAMGRFIKGAEFADDASLGSIKALNEEAVILQTDMSKFCKENGVKRSDFEKMLKEGKLSDALRDNEGAVPLFRRYQEGKEKYKKALDKVLKLADEVKNEVPGAIDEELSADGVEKNASLLPKPRLRKAEELLRKELSPAQKEAILKAHEVGAGGEGKFTKAELLEKARILEEAGFTKDERRVLMENGITGEEGRVAAFYSERGRSAPYSVDEYVIVLRSDGSSSVGKIIRISHDGREPIYEIRVQMGDGRTGLKTLTQSELNSHNRKYSEGMKVNTENGEATIVRRNSDGQYEVKMKDGSSSLFGEMYLDKMRMSTGPSGRIESTKKLVLALAFETNSIPLKVGIGADLVALGKRRLLVFKALEEIDKIPKSERDVSLNSLERHFQLEKTDLLILEVKIKTETALFNKLYPQGQSLEIMQGQRGNCYLLASINAIRKTSPDLFFEMILKNIKEVSPGLWEVTVPGSEFPGPYKIKQFGKDEIVNGVQIRSIESWQKEHSGTKAPLGDLILELASASDRSMNRSKVRGHTIIPFGLAADDGGFGHRAMYDMLGSEYVESKIATSKWQGNATLRQQGVTMANKAGGFLQLMAENANHYIMTANTKNFGNGVRIKVNGRELVGPHAYTILKYDKTKKVVQLGDPHDTSRPFEISLDDFLDNFSQLSFVSLTEQATPLGQFISGFRDLHSPVLMQQALKEKLLGADIYSLTGVKAGDTVNLKRVLEKLVDSEKNPILASVLKWEFQDIAGKIGFSLAA